jgi:hypothetical protein
MGRTLGGVVTTSQPNVKEDEEAGPMDHRTGARIRPPCPRHLPVMEKPQRPAWLNWLFLAMFLWSSWQLAGLWFQRLAQG